MKIKGKSLPKIKISRVSIGVSGLLVWRIVLALAVVACFAAAGMLWFSGGHETETALSDGRRLVMTLETGEITGKQLKAEEVAPPPATEKPAEETATASKDEPPADATPDEKEPDETTPDENASTEAKPDETAPESAGQPDEVKPEETAPDAAAPDETAQPAEPATDMQTPQPDESAAPVPLTYDQLPAMSMPVNQSSVPAVLPPTVSDAPLKDAPLPEMTPAKIQPAELSSQLVEESAEGKVPVVAADGTKAWKHYARPFARNSREPMIAIVITGLGNNAQVTQHALGLPENITLGFSPYSKQIEQWNKSAHLTGHEVMLELPLEPVDYPSTDPGPYGLMLGKGAQENERRLRWLMARIPTSVGFIIPKNEKFTRSEDDFKLLLKSLGNRGLMVLLPGDPASDDTRNLLQETSTPNIAANFLVDEELSEDVIKSRLYELEAIAKEKGYAVGIVRPYPISIAQLKAWMVGLAKKGIILVPVTAIAKLDYS